MAMGDFVHHIAILVGNQGHGRINTLCHGTEAVICQMQLTSGSQKALGLQDLNPGLLFQLPNLCGVRCQICLKFLLRHFKGIIVGLISPDSQSIVFIIGLS